MSLVSIAFSRFCLLGQDGSLVWWLSEPHGVHLIPSVLHSEVVCVPVHLLQVGDVALQLVA